MSKSEKVSKIRVVSVAVAALICFAFVMCSVVMGVKLGDINQDGTVNSVDNNLLKRFLSGTLDVADITKSGDINGDYEINAIDSNLLKRIVAGTFTPDDADVPESTEPTLSIESVKVSAGDNSVEVQINVQNNPGILAMMLTCTYDDSVMTLTGASNGEALSALNLTKPGKLASPCNFIWDGVELSESDIKDGTMLTLTFDIADTAKNGEYEITLSYSAGGIINNSMQPVEIEIENGSIIIG